MHTPYCEKYLNQITEYSQMTPFEHTGASLMLIEKKNRCCFFLLALILSPFFAAKLLEWVVWANSLSFLPAHSLLDVSNLVVITPFCSNHKFEGHQPLSSQTSGLSAVLVFLRCLAYLDAINHFPLLLKPLPSPLLLPSASPPVSSSAFSVSQTVSSGTLMKVCPEVLPAPLFIYTFPYHSPLPSELQLDLCTVDFSLFYHFSHSLAPSVLHTGCLTAWNVCLLNSLCLAVFCWFST